MLDGKRLMTIVTLYLCAIMQGFVMVAIPASSLFFKQDLGLTDSYYSTLFLPQLLMAIVGAFFGNFTFRRIALPTTLILGVVSNTIAMFLLFYAGAGILTNSIYFVLLLAAAFIGLGFGLCSAPLSTFPAWLFPNKGSSAMVALHSVVGVGFMLGPQFVSNLSTYDSWSVYPMWVTILGLTLLMNLLFVVEFPSRKDALADLPEPLAAVAAVAISPWKTGVLWIGILVVILYAFCESTLSNWAVIYLHEEKHISQENASWALSGFWAGLTVGRFMISTMLAYIPSFKIWQFLPIAMILPFLLMNMIEGPMMGAFVFILGGLTCSAFFPLTIQVLSEYFPDRTESMASIITAALMVGIGLGSYILGPLRSVVSLSILYQYAMVYPILMVILTTIAVSKWHRGLFSPLESSKST